MLNKISALILSVFLLQGVALAQVNWSMSVNDAPGNQPGINCGNVVMDLKNLSTAGEVVSFDYATDYGTPTVEVVPQRWLTVELEAGEELVKPIKMIKDQRLYVRLTTPENNGNWSSWDASFNDSCIDCDNLNITSLDDIAVAVNECGIDPGDIEVTAIEAKIKISTQ